MSLVSLLAKIKLEGAEETVQYLKKAESGFKQVAESAQKASPHVAAFAHALESISTPGKAAGTALGGIVEGVSAVAGVIGNAISAVGGLSAKLAGLAAIAGGALGVFAFTKAEEFDSVVRGLATVSDGYGSLGAKIKAVRDIAKLPGLGFKEAAEGLLSLQAAGVSAGLAERSLMAFGNALASAGKGKADLQGVLLQIQQIASSGKVTEQDVKPLSSRLPQFRKALFAAFGTGDAEAINKLGLSAEQFVSRVTAQLEKLPKATGGIRNDMENLSDRVEQIVLKLGQGIASAFSSAGPTIESLLDKAEKVFTAVGEVIAAAGQSGAIASSLNLFVGGLGFKTTGGVQEAAANITASILAVVALAPRAIRETYTFIADGFNYLLNQLNVFLIRAEASIQENIIAPIAAAAFNIQGVRDANTAAFALNNMADTVSGLVPPPQNTFGFLGEDFNSVRKDFLTQIMTNIKPIPDLPAGLNFGGEPVAQSAGKAQSALEKIERNTRESADALTLRRQAFGGGELGKIGVTGMEAMGGSRSFTPGSSLVPAASELERLLRRIAREEAARSANGGHVTVR
jgi:tape measure domain-containing protein